ncbi:NfeD family protein [Nocardioides sp.]|uniref:NfeD family protein n=1 Tax=Nocardioides sp. TaxID=35761 RepID=UPI003D0DD47E
MDWFTDNAWQAWLGLMALLVVLELFSMDLVLLMLAAGAATGALTAATGLPFEAQLLAAAAASTAMLVLVRPSVVKRLHTGPELRLGHGKLVGHQGIVTEQITAQEHGRIKLDGEIWSAAPYDEFETITPGETVEVIEIRGATAYVHPIPQLDN